MSGQAQAAFGADVVPRRSLVVAIGLVGAILGALALPAAGGRLVEVTGKPALARLAEGGRLTADGYRRLFAARSEALTWLAEPRIEKELGVALQGVAVREPGTPLVELLTAARDHFEAALEEAPADPIAWMQLAELHAALLDISRAAAALRASHAAGPVAPEIALQRAALALGLWAWLGDGLRGQAQGELPAAFRRDPATLARVAAATGRLNELRGALAGDPVALRTLEAQLATLRPVEFGPRKSAG